MHENKYACIKKDANVQKQVYIKIAAKVVWQTAKRELQKRNCKRGRVLITTDGNSQI